MCSFVFILYLVFMTALTTALVLAARSSDPRDYSQQADGLRLFCEIYSLIVGVVIGIFEELNDLYET